MINSPQITMAKHHLFKLISCTIVQINRANKTFRNKLKIVFFCLLWYELIVMFNLEINKSWCTFKIFVCEYVFLSHFLSSINDLLFADGKHFPAPCLINSFTYSSSVSALSWFRLLWFWSLCWQQWAQGLMWFHHRTHTLTLRVSLH